MKKICLTVFIILSVYQFSMAQWTTSGANIYNSNSGNVGIGTTNPTTGLLVAQGLITSQTATSLTGNNDAFNLYAGGGGYNNGARQSILWSQSGLTVGRFGTEYNAPRGQVDFVWRDLYNTGASSVESMRLTGGGNLGIGTTTPNTKLDVNGVISMQTFGYISSQRSSNNNYTNLFLGGAIKDNNDGTYTVMGDGGSNYFTAIRMDNGGNNTGGIGFFSGAATGGSSYTITNANLPNYLTMFMTGGNVSIGTTDSKGYKFAVNGSAIATSMTVKLYANWPDYVFNKEYRLASLQEVKTYIDQNRHLPDMPSGQEIAKDGLNLGEMNKILTKKVEELTLYLIEKDKQINDLTELQQEERRIQNEKLKQLENRLEHLETTEK